jgi:hypothetical protein
VIIAGRPPTRPSRVRSADLRPPLTAACCMRRSPLCDQRAGEGEWHPGRPVRHAVRQIVRMGLTNQRRPARVRHQHGHELFFYRSDPPAVGRRLRRRLGVRGPTGRSALRRSTDPRYNPSPIGTSVTVDRHLQGRASVMMERGSTPILRVAKDGEMANTARAAVG